MSPIRDMIRRSMRIPMESFEGLHCGCAPGTHAALTRLIDSVAKRRASVLDLGSRTGALLARLEHIGFSDLNGADRSEGINGLSGAKHHVVDLNTNFSEAFSQRFDLVTSTDVIEHLDSPRHFLTECRRLAAEDGLLALSFPNVAFFEGRLKFLLRGELWGFGARNYRTQRHISPTTIEQMLLTMQEVGWSPVKWDTAGSFATALRVILTAPLWLPIRALGGPTALGESTIVLARAAEPDRQLSMPSAYIRAWRLAP